MVHKLQCNTILFYGDLLLVSRTDGSQNLNVIPLIYAFVYIVTCKTHGYCNNRFQAYRGLLNRLQSYLNKSINSMDFKIATVICQEFFLKNK